MNTFALGRAFQAAGADMGVATQMQYNQAMSQQQAAQRLQAQSAHDGFMKSMQDSRIAAEANQTQSNREQQQGQFDQRMAATQAQTAATNAYRTQTLGLKKISLAQSGALDSIRGKQVKADIAKTVAATNKLKSSGPTGVPTQYDLVHTQALLVDTIGKVNAQLTSNPSKAQAQTLNGVLNSLTQNLASVQNALKVHYPAPSGPAPIVNAPAGAQPPVGARMAIGPGGQKLFYVNGQFVSYGDAQAGTGSGP